MILTAPTSVSSGASKTFEVHSGIRLCLIPASSTTVTISRVDSLASNAHDSISSSNYTTRTTVDIDWPFYHVSSAGGTTRVSVV